MDATEVRKFSTTRRDGGRLARETDEDPGDLHYSNVNGGENMGPFVCCCAGSNGRGTRGTGSACGSSKER